MSEQDMVERAARASYAKMTEIVAIRRPAGDFIAWDALPEGQRRIMLASQRAAIAALREPTPAMRKAGEYAIDEYLHEDTDLHCWHAMIDKALESK